MKAIVWDDDAAMGSNYHVEEIPADLLDQAEEYREKMIEAAAESSEELMEKYFEEGELSEEEIIGGLKSSNFSNANYSNDLWYCIQKQRCSNFIRRCCSCICQLQQKLKTSKVKLKMVKL